MKTLCYDNNPFMNKALRKAIMNRLRLKNKFDKNNCEKMEQLLKAKKFLSKVITSI